MEESTSVKFDLGLRRLKGTVVRDNGKSVVISFVDPSTGEVSEVKRHKEKHDVEIVSI